MYTSRICGPSRSYAGFRKQRPQIVRAQLTGPKPKEIKVETFRINYLIRSPKVEKLGFEPVSQ